MIAFIFFCRLALTHNSVHFDTIYACNQVQCVTCTPQMRINKCFKTTIDVYLATFELAIVVLSAAVIIDVCAATPTIRECSDANSAIVAVVTACWNVRSSPRAKRHSRVAACANPTTKLQSLANPFNVAANSAVDSVVITTTKYF